MLPTRLFDHRLTTPIVNEVFNVTTNEHLSPEIMSNVIQFYYWLENHVCYLARMEKTYPTAILQKFQEELKNPVTKAFTRSKLYRTFSLQTTSKP